MNHQLIVVSNRLPYFQNNVQKWERASGGLINAVEPIAIKTGGIWIGWDGNTSKTFNHYQVNKLSQETKHLPDAYKIGCVPLSKMEISQYYDHFSNETLWALFHYFFEKSTINYMSWSSYKKVNQRFAQCIDQVANDDDLIWIHDYHLMLVPYYLKKLRPHLHIHFFLHIPFPHFDIYSILPWGKQILESLICCTSIGFHHQQYLVNFKGAAFELLNKTIEDKCFVNPISIDFDLFDSTSRKQSVLDLRNQFKRSMGQVQIMLGVDRIDYSKGIRERLLAIERILETNPNLKEKFVYYQLTIPSRENVVSYQKMKKEVDELVGRINGSYSTEKWCPIHYHYGTAHFDQLIAYYLASDIALVTPLRDGMNLVCKEYIASHSDENGVLILSKFAGAFSQIKDCLSINPYSVDDIQKKILQALNMPKGERTKRMKKMRKSIKNHDNTSWWNTCSAHFT